MTAKDISIDGEGNRRCWNCGGRSFELLESLGARVIHHHDADSLQESKTLKCDRCGAHNRTGNAKNFQGPADATYEAEWAAESAAVHRPYFEPKDPPRPQDPTAEPQLELDIVNTLPPD
jgi:hypothetical protein